MRLDKGDKKGEFWGRIRVDKKLREVILLNLSVQLKKIIQLKYSIASDKYLYLAMDNQPISR